MNIPHLVRQGGFRPLIAEALKQRGCPGTIKVNLGKIGGYSGSVEITVGGPRQNEFEAAIDLKDWTRFPARIRAAATALRDRGCTGRFRVVHEDGVLVMTRL